METQTTYVGSIYIFAHNTFIRFAFSLIHWSYVANFKHCVTDVGALTLITRFEFNVNNLTAWLSAVLFRGMQALVSNLWLPI